MGADAWSSGESYDAYVGRWSSLVAARFVPWLDRPAGGRWLDVSCGTGALTRAVLATGAPAAVLGVEPSEPFGRRAARGAEDLRARFVCADAQALPVATAAVDTVLSALVLNFLPDPAAAVAGMVRAVRPGGCVAAYVWDYAGGMELIGTFWDAVAELDPPARARHEARRFGSWQPPRAHGAAHRRRGWSSCRPGPCRSARSSASTTTGRRSCAGPVRHRPTSPRSTTRRASGCAGR
ncbi:MAG: putative methyltransferase,S-adenosyl-L-methionine (SAM)-MTase protein [Frankiales bacterium]|nr:putative methyltransferase,S-adenosyl-L-methionine (SAM)-MTase protein [Frankiales bacterium]